MLARVRSAAVLGIEAYPVEVEVDLAGGLPSFTTVGLPLGAVREGRERVTAALANSGFELPLKRITANLAPADVPKAGSAFDLPIAVGVLVGSGQLRPAEPLEHGVLFGELGLDGTLRPLRGTLPLVACARGLGARWVVVPAANVAEGTLIDGVEVYGASTLGEVVAHLAGTARLTRGVRSAQGAAAEGDLDFADVRGQLVPKRALEVAAAGGHNVLMVGPPGAGKTMLARRLPSILPPLDRDEALVVTTIHSVAGLLDSSAGLVLRRPFRAPHHTVSDAGMAGGGPHPRPGEVSLAHHGVLFLDEMPEFRRNVLEVLRQPLEDRLVTLARAALTVAFPAGFQLVGAMNPCPCGFLGDPRRSCLCSPERVRGYRGRVSGPLYDRIDLHLEVPSVSWDELSGGPAGEGSAAIRERVGLARSRQEHRYASGPGVRLNSALSGRDIDRWCRPDAEGRRLLGAAMERMGWSARAYARVVKVARTIADLEGAPTVRGAHVAEAVQYRSFERISERADRPSGGAGTRPG